MAESYIEPFRVDVADQVLDDLRRRLEATRWPGEADDAAWQYGANLGYMKRLAAYWLEGYDWRRAEAELNRFSHFTAPLSDPELGDFRIHLVREEGDGESPIPLIVSHGWPGSFVELLGLVDPLAHPDSAAGAPAFDVIVPSLPGYGFREMVGTRYGLLRAECTYPLFPPWVGIRAFAALGATHLPSQSTPDRWHAHDSDGLRPSVGVGLSFGWDVLRLDLGRGLRDGGWELTFAVDPRFYPWL